MNSVLSKVIVAIVSLFGVVFFSYQIYLLMYSPYQTQIAQSYAYNDQVEINGVAIKNEVLLPKEFEGILKYTKTNAKKVSSNDPIAKVYSSQLDLINDNLIEKLTSRLNLLADMNQKNIVGSMNIQSVISNLSKIQLEVLNNVSQNEFEDIDDNIDDFLSLMLRQQLAINPTITYDEQIVAIQNQINELSSTISQDPQIITAPTSGYFTNFADGFEGVVTQDIFNNLTLDSLNQVLSLSNTQNDTSGYIGKILLSTQWQFVSLVEAKDMSRFQLNKTVNLIFTNNTSQTVKGTVSQIIPAAKNDYGIVVIDSNIMNSDIINIRYDTPVVLFNSSSGLRISKSALRMIDNQAGVYVNKGQIIKFKKVEILYETENYIYSKIVDDSDYLQLYDEVIIEGTDLYDDKPI